MSDQTLPLILTVADVRLVEPGSHCLRVTGGIFTFSHREDY